MERTPEEIEADLRAHLHRVGGRQTCPVCDRDDWHYLHVNDGPTIAHDYARVPGLVYRLCGCCAHIQAFDDRVITVRYVGREDGTVYADDTYPPSWPAPAPRPPLQITHDASGFRTAGAFTLRLEEFGDVAATLRELKAEVQALRAQLAGPRSN